MSSAPWIWAMITSLPCAGTWFTTTVALRAWRSVPAAKLVRLSSSVRAWSEFFVVAPATGVQNTSAPAGSVVRYGGATTAGSMMAASPFPFAVGSVSFQPASVGAPAEGAALGGAAGGGADGGGEGDEHAATTHAAAISRHARTPVDRNRRTTPSMVAQSRNLPVREVFDGAIRALSSCPAECTTRSPGRLAAAPGAAR